MNGLFHSFVSIGRKIWFWRIVVDLCPMMVKDRMISKNLNHQDNQFVVGRSLGIGMNSDIGKDAHQSPYIDDPRIYYPANHAENHKSLQNIPRGAMPHSDSSATFSGLRPALSSAAEGNSRAAVTEQGNFFSSIAQSMPNLAYSTTNVNMNLNHQQMNALNASLNSVGTINNVNFPKLRNMFLPDSNASLSNANRFQSNQHPSFPRIEYMSLPNNHNHRPVANTDDVIVPFHSRFHNAERYFGKQSMPTQGPMDDSVLNGSASNDKNTSWQNNLDKRKGVEVTEVQSLSSAKRARHEDSPLDRPATQTKWDDPPGRSFPLYSEKDQKNLSRYQCLARQQMEIFEANSEDAGNNAQGRNRPILVGQVGIRCKHCYMLPSKQRKTGSVYYPNKARKVIATV